MAMINHGLAINDRQRGGRGATPGLVFAGPLPAGFSTASGGFPPFRPLPARLKGMAACLGGIRPQLGSAVAIPGLLRTGIRRGAELFRLVAMIGGTIDVDGTDRRRHAPARGTELRIANRTSL